MLSAETPTLALLHAAGKGALPRSWGDEEERRKEEVGATAKASSSKAQNRGIARYE